MAEQGGGGGQRRQRGFTAGTARAAAGQIPGAQQARQGTVPGVVVNVGLDSQQFFTDVQSLQAWLDQNADRLGLLIPVELGLDRATAQLPTLNQIATQFERTAQRVQAAQRQMAVDPNVAQARAGVASRIEGVQAGQESLAATQLALGQVRSAIAELSSTPVTLNIANAEQQAERLKAIMEGIRGAAALPGLPPQIAQQLQGLAAGAGFVQQRAEQYQDPHERADNQAAGIRAAFSNTVPQVQQAAGELEQTLARQEVALTAQVQTNQELLRQDEVRLETANSLVRVKQADATLSALAGREAEASAQRQAAAARQRAESEATAARQTSAGMLAASAASLATQRGPAAEGSLGALQDQTVALFNKYQASHQAFESFQRQQITPSPGADVAEMEQANVLLQQAAKLSGEFGESNIRNAETMHEQVAIQTALNEGLAAEAKLVADVAQGRRNALQQMTIRVAQQSGIETQGPLGRRRQASEPSGTGPIVQTQAAAAILGQERDNIAGSQQLSAALQKVQGAYEGTVQSIRGSGQAMQGWLQGVQQATPALAEESSAVEKATSAHAELTGKMSASEASQRSFGELLGYTISLYARYAIVGEAITLATGAISGTIDVTRRAITAHFELQKAVGDSADAYQKFADRVADQGGFARVGGEEATANLARLRNEYGLTDKQVQNLVQSSADLARVNGTDLATSATAVEHAMEGNSRSLENYGVVVSTRALKEMGHLTDAQEKNLSKLGETELAQVRYNEIIRQSSAYHGAAADYADKQTSAYERLTASASNLAQTLGTSLAPSIGGIEDRFSGLVKKADEWIQQDAAMAAAQQGRVSAQARIGIPDQFQGTQNQPLSRDEMAPFQRFSQDVDSFGYAVEHLRVGTDAQGNVEVHGPQQQPPPPPQYPAEQGATFVAPGGLPGGGQGPESDLDYHRSWWYKLLFAQDPPPGAPTATDMRDAWWNRPQTATGTATGGPPAPMNDARATLQQWQNQWSQSNTGMPLSDFIAQQIQAMPEAERRQFLQQWQNLGGATAQSYGTGEQTGQDALGRPIYNPPYRTQDPGAGGSPLFASPQDATNTINQARRYAHIPAGMSPTDAWALVAQAPPGDRARLEQEELDREAQQFQGGGPGGAGTGAYSPGQNIAPGSAPPPVAFRQVYNAGQRQAIGALAKEALTEQQRAQEQAYRDEEKSASAHFESLKRGYEADLKSANLAATEKKNTATKALDDEELAVRHTRTAEDRVRQDQRQAEDAAIERQHTLQTRALDEERTQVERTFSAEETAAKNAGDAAVRAIEQRSQAEGRAHDASLQAIRDETDATQRRIQAELDLIDKQEQARADARQDTQEQRAIHDAERAITDISYRDTRDPKVAAQAARDVADAQDRLRQARAAVGDTSHDREIRERRAGLQQELKADQDAAAKRTEAENQRHQKATEALAAEQQQSRDATDAEVADIGKRKQAALDEIDKRKTALADSFTAEQALVAKRREDEDRDLADRRTKQDEFFQLRQKAITSQYTYETEKAQTQHDYLVALAQNEYDNRKALIDAYIEYIGNQSKALDEALQKWVSTGKVDGQDVGDSIIGGLVGAIGSGPNLDKVYQAGFDAAKAAIRGAIDGFAGAKSSIDTSGGGDQSASTGDPGTGAAAAGALVGARQGGGFVMPGRAYLVGEDGPELLRMGANGGSVVPIDRNDPIYRAVYAPYVVPAQNAWQAPRGLPAPQLVPEYKSPEQIVFDKTGGTITPDQQARLDDQKRAGMVSDYETYKVPEVWGDGSFAGSYRSMNIGAGQSVPPYVELGPRYAAAQARTVTPQMPTSTTQAGYYAAAKSAVNLHGLDPSQLPDFTKAPISAPAPSGNYASGNYSASSFMSGTYIPPNDPYWQTHQDYRASGGQVVPGRRYVVGERGPEMLEMGMAGGYVDAAPGGLTATDMAGYTAGRRGEGASMLHNVGPDQLGQVFDKSLSRHREALSALLPSPNVVVQGGDPAASMRRALAAAIISRGG